MESRNSMPSVLLPPCGTSPSAVQTASVSLDRGFSNAFLQPAGVTYASTPFYEDEAKKNKAEGQNQVTDAEQGTLEAVLNGEEEKTHEPQAHWYHASFHVVCAMVGTGVLGLPKAMSQLTWGPGMALLAGAFVITYFMSSLVGKLAQGPNGERHGSYVDMCRAVLSSKRTRWLVMPFLYAGIVGPCIAYLITAGENINSIYVENCGSSCTSIRQLVWTTCIAVIEMVLCLFPTLEKLAFVSLLGAAMSAGYATIAVVMSFVMAGNLPYEVSYGLSGSVADGVFGVFTGITTIVFAFNFATVQPDIQATLKGDPNRPEAPRKAMQKAITLAYAFVFFAYFLSAISGYYAFGNMVNGDVLLSLSQYASSGVERGFVTAAQVMVIIHVTLAYQVFAMVVYMALEKAYAQKKGKRCPRLIRYVMRWVFIICTWFVAIAIPFFSDMMSLIGAISFVPLVFIIPCSLYLIRQKDEGNSVKTPMKVFLLTIIAFAVLVGIVGVIGSIYSIVQDAGTFSVFK